MRQFLIGIVVTGVTVVAMLGIVEIALRVAPSLIGIAILERFEPGLRSEIVARLGMSTRNDTLVIASEQRLDRGPDINLGLPNRRYVRAVDEVDAAAGAVDHYETDALGFCNPPGVAEARPVDVLTVGGSIPNCAAVTGENNFTAWLGRELQAASYNMAVPGVGPYEYVEVLRRFGLALKPRVVVMAISEGDDLDDVLSHRKFMARAGKPRRKRSSGGLFSISYALAFFKGGIELAVRTIKDSGGPDFRYEVKVRGGTVPLNVANNDASELEVARLVDAGKVAADVYAESLGTFAALAREGGFRPLVVMVPSAYTTYLPTIKYSDGAIAPVMERFAVTQRRWLEKTATDAGMAYFDATPYMQKAAADRPLLYFPSNIHLTPEGHKALAEAVAPAVRALLAQ